MKIQTLERKSNTLANSDKWRARAAGVSAGVPAKANSAEWRGLTFGLAT